MNKYELMSDYSRLFRTFLPLEYGWRRAIVLYGWRVAGCVAYAVFSCGLLSIGGGTLMIAEQKGPGIGGLWAIAWLGLFAILVSAPCVFVWHKLTDENDDSIPKEVVFAVLPLLAIWFLIFVGAAISQALN